MTVASPFCNKSHCTEPSFLLFTVQTSSFCRIGSFKSLGFTGEKEISQKNK